MANTVKEAWEMECPRCHRDDKIYVRASVWIRLEGVGEPVAEHPTQEEIKKGAEWEPDSVCECGHCHFMSRVKTFEL